MDWRAWLKSDLPNKLTPKIKRINQVENILSTLEGIFYLASMVYVLGMFAKGFLMTEKTIDTIYNTNDPNWLPTERRQDD